MTGGRREYQKALCAAQKTTIRRWTERSGRPLYSMVKRPGQPQLGPAPPPFHGHPVGGGSACLGVSISPRKVSFPPGPRSLGVSCVPEQKMPHLHKGGWHRADAPAQATVHAWGSTVSAASCTRRAQSESMDQHAHRCAR